MQRSATSFLALVFLCLLAPVSAVGAITASLVPSRTTGVAPLAVYFDAAATTATGVTHPIHELEYTWEFGDPTAGTWAISGQNKNAAIGPAAAHVFMNPGTYQVVLKVRQATGESATKSVTITVTDPNIVFSGTKTICFSPDGDFTGAPAGAQHVTTSSMTTVFTHLAPNRRLLLKRGATFTSGTNNLDTTGPGILGSFGPASAPPRLDGSNATFFNVEALDWRILDMEFQGNSASGTAAMQVHAPSADVLVMHTRVVPNTVHAVISSALSSPDKMFIVENHWHDTGFDLGGCIVFMMVKRLALLGNVMDDGSGAEHIVRLVQCEKGVVSHNYFARPREEKALLTIRSKHNQKTFEVFVSDNTFITDWGGIGMVNRNASTQTPYGHDIIVERNFFRRLEAVGKPSTYAINTESVDRVTIRNNIALFNNWGPTLVDGRDDRPKPVNSIWIYNNTLYSPDNDPTKSPSVSNIRSGSGHIIKNNLVYAPGLDDAFALARGTASFTASHNLRATANPFVSSTLTEPAHYQLHATSAAINAGTVVPVHDDFAHLQRPQGAAHDVGAFERNAAPEITTTSLPSATVGQTYSTSLSANGGTGALVWSVSAGSLPAGVTLSAAGVLSGTPSVVGTSTFTIKVGDSDEDVSATDEDTAQFSLTVSEPLVITTPPASATRVAGSNLTLTVAATGASSYQWFKDGAAISGATGTSLALTNLLPVATGSYTVRIGNGVDTVTSPAATVSVRTLPFDAQGWTVITPSPDSRVVYVSSSQGNDANSGLSPASPKATIAAGNALIRDGFPDHLLLKRGDTFSITASTALGSWKNGRNASEPAVMSYYGETGPRPVIKIVDRFLDHGGATRNWQAFIGLDIYKSNSDPASPDFANVSASEGFRLVGGAADFLVEDCRLRFTGIVVQSYEAAVYSNLRLARNIILDTWMKDSWTLGADARIAGAYISGVQGYTLEENVFDHNGWSETVPNAGANQYNHNLYVQYDNSAGGIMRGNILARGSAHGLQARSGGVVERNLLIGNAVSVNLGGLNAPTDPDVLTFPNRALENVVLNGRLMDPTSTSEPRTAAIWGITATFITNVLVADNIIANRVHSGSNRAFDGVANMIRTDNIVHQWDPAYDSTNPSWPHPQADIADYYVSIGGTDSSDIYYAWLRNRPLRRLPWEMTAYAANTYIRSGFNRGAIAGYYDYPNDSTANVIVLTVTASDAAAGEPAHPGQFTVTASPAPAVPLTVDLALSGSATTGADYATINTSVTVGTSGTAVINVTPLDDAFIENPESVVLTLAPGADYVLGATRSATVTITDDENDGSGLIAHWKLDETSGSTVADSSGHGNTGLINGAAPSAGTIAGAYDFAQATAVINGGSGASLDTPAALTLSAWIKPRTAGHGTTFGRIFQKGNGTNSPAGYRLTMASNSQVEFFVDYSSLDLTRRTQADSISLNTWQHVVATWDGSSNASQAKIYINGVEVGGYATTTNGSGTRPDDGATDLRLGNNDLLNRGFDGLIDDVRIYDRALSASEVSALFTNTVPVITTTTLPAGETNTAYSQSLTATGGNGTLVWNLAAGSLPAGLSLSSAGLIAGTPAAAGTATFTVKVADSDLVTGGSDEAIRPLSITIASPSLPANYTAWAASHGLTEEERAPLLDLDGDGLKNLAEFAFGSDPGTSNPQSCTVSILSVSGQNYPALTFVRRQNRAPVVINVRISADLSPASDLGSIPVSTTPNGDDTETVVVRSAVPLSTHPRQFFHLTALLP